MDSATFSGLGQGLNQATGTMLSTGMQLNKLQADEQIRRDTLAMHQQQMNQSALQHQQTLAIAQQQANTAQEHLPPSRLPFNETTLNGLKNKFLLQGLPKDVADNILSPLEPMAKDQNMYRGDIANRLEQGWDSTFKPNIIAQLKTYSNGLAEKLGKMEQTDPNYKKLSTQLDKTDKIMGAFESITPEKVIPGFFPDILEERENTKAALQANKPDVTTNDMKEWKFAVDSKQTKLTFPQWLEKTAKDKRAPDTTGQKSALEDKKITAKALQDKEDDLTKERRNLIGVGGMMLEPAEKQASLAEIDAAIAEVRRQRLELGGNKITDKSKASKIGGDEHSLAEDAIKQGADPSVVKAMYKKRTGKEF